MNEFIPSFSDSLFNDTVDIGKEVLELSVDSVLEDGLLRDIPIVGMVAGIGKIYVNLRERSFIKQTLAFLYEFKSGTIDTDKLARHNEELMKNKALFEKELETILVYLDRNTEIHKSRVDAKLYIALIHNDISFDRFCEFLEITNRMFLSDLSALEEAYNNEGVAREMEVSYRHERLISLGLLGNRPRLTGAPTWGEIGGLEPKMMEMTEIGKEYCKIIF